MVEPGDAEPAALDLRESNYHRIDVSARTGWEGMPDKAVVYTYVPTAEPQQQLETTIKEGTAGVSAQYLWLIKEAFTMLGVLDEYHRSHQIPPLGA